MSDSEDDYSGCESDSSFSDIESQLQQMTTLVGTLNGEIEMLETRMMAMQRPIESLHIDQLGDIPFVVTSPFRHHTFAIQAPGIPGIPGIPGVDINKRHAFHEICTVMRAHIFHVNAVQADGTIVMDASLQKLFHTKEKLVTYPHLMRLLRKVLV